MSFLAAIPTIASFASSLFGKKKTSGGETVPAAVQLPGYQQQAGQSLGNYIQQYLSQYQPGKAYGGDFTASMTDSETTGIDRLNRFLAAPELSGLFGAANQNVMDTLGGKFADPNTSPFIKAAINLSKYNLRDSIDASRRSAGARGNYFSKAAIQDEGRIMERSQAGLDAIIGDYINQERGRQQTAVTQAQALDKYANYDIPLAKIGASQTYGALPRMIEQADLESRYNDFQRQQTELGQVPGQAQALFSNNTPYTPSYTTPVQTQNSSLNNILSMIGKLNLGGFQGGGDIWSKLATVLKG